MRAIFKKILSIVFISLFLAIPSSFAKGKGGGSKNEAPAGWTQGEKKGWESDTPPGQEKVKGNVDKIQPQRKEEKGSEKQHRKQNNKVKNKSKGKRID